MLSRTVAPMASTFAALLFSASAGHARAEAQPQIPLPRPGDVTLARLAVQSTGSHKGPPRLTIGDVRGLPAGAFAVVMVNRSTGPSRFLATVTIISPRPADSAPRSSKPTRFVGLRLPSGYTLARPPQIVRDALYMNRLPSFGLLTNGVATVLAGRAPMLPPDRIVRDAQLLALDRSVPLADMGLLGLEFVAVQFANVGGTNLRATIGTSVLDQVSAVELRFPNGISVPRVTGAEGTGTIRVGNPVQLVATQGIFQSGLSYGFTLQLNRPLRAGDAVIVRASTHYFESSLPFTERFFIG